MKTLSSNQPFTATSLLVSKLTRQLVLCAGMGMFSLMAVAQETAPSFNHTVTDMVQLSSSATVSASQDFLKINLTTTKEGMEASQVQEQLKKAVDETLKQLKNNSGALQYAVNTGNFSLSPRYNNQGKVNGWQGTAEMSIEGKDFAAITQASGAVKSMVINSITFSLSEEKRLEAVSKAQTIAIDRFKQKSQTIAKSFGFSSYNLKNVVITDTGFESEPIFTARSKNMAFAMADVAPSPVPVQAGSSDVVVKVSGSILLKN